MGKLAITIDGRTFEVDLTLPPQCANMCAVSVDGEDVSLVVPDLNGPIDNINWMVIDDRPYELNFDETLRWIRAWSGLHEVEIQDLEAKVTRPRSGDGRIKAPIPGLITRVLVAEGDAVEADQPLLVLEAMKMENEIRAPFDGVVGAIRTAVGQTVVRNEVLAEVK